MARMWTWLKGFWQRPLSVAASPVPPVEGAGSVPAESETPAPTAPPARLTRPAFTMAWASEVGRVRAHNEDGLFVFAGEERAANAMVPFGLFVVSDGMGGHQSGELASALAMRVAAGQLISQIYLPLVSGSDRTADQLSLTEVLVDAISKANAAITHDLPGSGCTLTCAMALGDRLYVGHVGDSRAYLLRAGAESLRLTKDHSFVGRLIELGQLTEQEAAVHPKRNVLYRAIGQPGELEVDVSTQTLQNGDRLLLCSDGLWGMVGEPEMWRTVDKADSLQEACSQLVGAANLAGGHDNITVVLAELWPVLE